MSRGIVEAAILRVAVRRADALAKVGARSRAEVAELRNFEKLPRGWEPTSATVGGLPVGMRRSPRLFVDTRTGVVMGSRQRKILVEVVGDIAADAAAVALGHSANRPAGRRSATPVEPAGIDPLARYMDAPQGFGR